MRTLSEGWGTKGERHRYNQNQSRTFHLAPPLCLLGLVGTRQVVLPVLTEDFLYGF
jgi:hypothetical protein